MARALAFALGLALVLPASAVPAGEQEPAAPGIRVRLTAPGLADKPIIGTLTALEENAVSLRPEGRLEAITVPRSAVMKWELSQGVHANTAKGAAWGFLGGAAVGVGLAASEYEGIEAPLVYAAFMGAAGAGVGALLGALHKSERWQEVDERPLRINLVPVRDGVGLSVQWSFGGGGSRTR
jgi:hypothetical protein